MADSTRVLCVGGDTLAPAVKGLEGSDGAFDVEFASDRREALSRLDERDADCIVCDVAAAANGIELLRAVADRNPAAPSVAVTDAANPEQARAALDAGATDFHRAIDGDVDGTTLARRIELAVERTGTRRPDPGDPSSVGDAPLDLDRFRSFADAVADPMYVLDDEGYYVLVNEAHVEYTGVDRTELDGVHASAVVGSDAYETASEAIGEWYRGGRERGTLEIPVRRADGERRIGETHVTILTDDEGAFAGTLGVVRDVTERQDRLRELGRYEAIVETAPIGLLAVDEDGVVAWHNDEFTNDLGIDGRDLVGTSFVELVSDGFFPGYDPANYADRVRRLLSAENDDERLSYEEEWIDADGEAGVTEVNMGLLPLEDGEFVGTVHAFRNVTERVANQRELERQNERLDNFASFVSHDLRNPLNVASGYVDLLQEAYEDPRLEEVGWALDRMVELIDDLLTLAREGATVGDPEPFSLAEVVEAAWSAVDTAGAHLAIDDDVEAVRFSGDPRRVKNLVENLVRNSLEHGSDAATADELTIRVGLLPADSGDETRHRGYGWAGFYVEDDGIGLPVDEDVFRSGFTTTVDGTGLGLAIVAEIAEAHGWAVDACEGADGGARFEFRGVTAAEEPGDEGVMDEEPADKEPADEEPEVDGSTVED